MIITTSSKNAKIEYKKEAFTYPINTIAYAVDESYTSLTLFRNNERIGTSPLEAVVVDGQQATKDNIDELLSELFKLIGEDITLPIDISDVSELPAALAARPEDWAGTTYYVDGTYAGDDSTGSPLKPFKTLQAAHDAFIPVNNTDELKIVYSPFPYYWGTDGTDGEQALIFTKNVTLWGSEDTQQYNVMIGAITISAGCNQCHLQNVQTLGLEVNNASVSLTAANLFVYASELKITNAKYVYLRNVRYNHNNPKIVVTNCTDTYIKDSDNIVVELNRGTFTAYGCTFGYTDDAANAMNALTVNSGAGTVVLIDCKFAFYNINQGKFSYHKIVNNANALIAAFESEIGSDNKSVQNVKYIDNSQDLSNYLQKQNGDGTTFLANDDTYKSINQVPDDGVNGYFLMRVGGLPAWQTPLYQNLIDASSPDSRTISGALLKANLDLKQDKLPIGTGNYFLYYGINGIEWVSPMYQGDIDLGATAVAKTISPLLLKTNLNTKVNKAGDTMSGALTLNGDPTSDLMAVPKQYVDSKIADLESNALSFKGFVSTTEPTLDVRIGNYWYNSDSLPIVFPITVSQYNGTDWTTQIEYTPNAFDVWDFNGNAWYYFGSAWEQLDFAGSTFDSDKFEIVNGVVKLKAGGITNNEVAANAGIEASKISGLPVIVNIPEQSAEKGISASWADDINEKLYADTIIDESVGELYPAASSNISISARYPNTTDTYYVSNLINDTLHDMKVSQVQMYWASYPAFTLGFYKSSKFALGNIIPDDLELIHSVVNTGASLYDYTAVYDVDFILKPGERLVIGAQVHTTVAPGASLSQSEVVESTKLVTLLLNRRGASNVIYQSDRDASIAYKIYQEAVGDIPRIDTELESIDSGLAALTTAVNAKPDLIGATTLMVLTQAEYDAIAVKDNNTIYFIKE